MKRSLAAITLFLSLALCAQAQNVTSEDREKALKYLESTKQAVIDATKDLSPAQWNFKAAPDKWSIAEVTGTHRRRRRFSDGNGQRESH